MVDFPPRVSRLKWLNDRDRPLIITEGSKKADSAVSRGLAAISIPGVWGWRDRDGVLSAIRDFTGLRNRPAYIAFDSDAMQKREISATPRVGEGGCRRCRATARARGRAGDA